jgi:hypothetical protein
MWHSIFIEVPVLGTLLNILDEFLGGLFYRATVSEVIITPTITKHHLMPMTIHLVANISMRRVHPAFLNTVHERLK